MEEGEKSQHQEIPFFLHPEKKPFILTIQEAIRQIEEKVGQVGKITKSIWLIGGIDFVPIDIENPVIQNQNGRYTLNYLPSDDQRVRNFKEAVKRFTELYIHFQDDFLLYAYFFKNPHVGASRYIKKLMLRLNTSPERREEIFASFSPAEKKAVANYIAINSGKTKKELPSWLSEFVDDPPTFSDSPPTDRDIILKEIGDDDNLYLIFNHFLSVQKQNPETLKHWRIKPKKRPKEYINKLILTLVRQIQPLSLPTQYTEGNFSELVFNFQEGTHAYENFRRCITDLNKRMSMVRFYDAENLQDPERIDSFRKAISLTISSLIKRAAEQILIAADCGECTLSDTEKKG